MYADVAETGHANAGRTRSSAVHANAIDCVVEAEDSEGRARAIGFTEYSVARHAGAPDSGIGVAAAKHASAGTTVCNHSYATARIVRHDGKRVDGPGGETPRSVALDDGIGLACAGRWSTAGSRSVLVLPLSPRLFSWHSATSSVRNSFRTWMKVRYGRAASWQTVQA